MKKEGYDGAWVSRFRDTKLLTWIDGSNNNHGKEDKGIRTPYHTLLERVHSTDHALNQAAATTLVDDDERKKKAFLLLRSRWSNPFLNPFFLGRGGASTAPPWIRWQLSLSWARVELDPTPAKLWQPLMRTEAEHPRSEHRREKKHNNEPIFWARNSGA